MKPDSQILIIFGASGDLTKRKLLPSLFELFDRDMLPEHFVILGVARTKYTNETYRKEQKENLRQFLKGDQPENQQLDKFLERVEYLELDTDNAEDYHLLMEKIRDIRKANDIADRLLFYLAIPPQKYELIAGALEKAELNKATEEGGWRRIIVEKPFGRSLETAQHLNRHITAVFVLW